MTKFRPLAKDTVTFKLYTNSCKYSIQFPVVHLALCLPKLPRNEQGRLQRMRRFPLASFPWFYAHNKVAPISTRLKDLLRKLHEYSDCSHKGCRNEDVCQNVGIYVAGLMKGLTIEVRTDVREGPLRKNSSNKRSRSSTTQNTRTRFREGNIPHKVRR